MSMMTELDKLAAEARALSANSVIIQTQEGRHLLNLLIRMAETASNGKPTTPAITTHNA